MLFSELSFVPFFAVYLLLHLLIPADKRIYLIIVGGSAFYAWWRLDYLWVPYTLTLIAFLGFEHLRFTKPVKPGDTIHAWIKVLEKRETSRPDRGVGGDERRDGEAVTHRLAHGHDIWRDAPMLAGEPLAGAIEPGLNLIENQ